MQLGYTPDYAETITASRIAARRIFSPWQRYWCWPYYILAAVAAYTIGFSAANWFRPAIGNQNANILAICVLVVVYVICAVIGIRLGRYLTARWLRQNSPERPTLFSLEPDGLQWRKSRTFVQLGFSDIDRIVLTPNLVGFLSGAGVSYVPHRAFDNADQVRTLVKAVFERLSEDAKLRSVEDAQIRSMVTV
ncbi:hypothetical protein RB623_15960 [Mesorhizobium sp. LHD-90]|uniref:hypothetical protein n=1 Tax=Mesorhizobium sp. LHD-90 TaxID=3071414 RepID=UPI0027DF6D44|nr:hypothetical protein [Mesorhizobium sp. LHD-90]MDQ6435553.1 hypothetical protein [Mesorhizobium sp. LHD-90]